MSDVNQNLERLATMIRRCGSLLVAYSGGVDSAVVMAVAARELGTQAMACIGESPSYPAEELRDAIRLAQELGCRHRIVHTAEHHDPNYLANTADRCFHCKSHLFQRLVEIAREEQLAFIADGVHRDDLRDHVGGMRAAQRFGVRSPLLEAELDKQQVRAIARLLKLGNSEKPAAPCLASRVPRGVPITLNILGKVARAERHLRDLGFVDFRVRHHGHAARIEVTEAQLPMLLQRRESIEQALAEIGYAQVSVDLRRGDAGIKAAV